VRFSTLANLGLLAAAALAGAAPIPPALVERVYSTGAYPVLQRFLTPLSNRAPFALMDLLIAFGLVWCVVAGAAVGRLFQRGARQRVRRLIGVTAVPAAALYLAFLALWGFNYRRLPLEAKLAFDAGSVTPDAARSLAEATVARVNALYGDAHAAGWGDEEDSLPAPFEAALREAGASGATAPGRPRWTLLDWYFRSAAVAGMTDPFFLETLVVSDLLPFERPFVIAHEWSHLAGFADEGEANFIGWLTCVRGQSPAQYSGWLSLYTEVFTSVSRRDRADLAARLASGPREDLRAMADRLSRNVSPRVSAAGWRVYDRYLKANRVEDGAASYARVVRLVLGSELGQRASRAGLTAGQVGQR
jgi:hypothetical protein